MTLPTRLKSLAIALAAVLFTAPQRIHAETIRLDFDNAPNQFVVYGDYFEDGFRLSNQGHYDIFDGVMQLDTSSGGGGGIETIDHGGSTFDFLSLEIVTLLFSPEPWSNEILGTAFVTSSRGGYSQITDLGVMTFSGSDWTDVSWVKINLLDADACCGNQHSDHLEFDNIGVSVPEPSSALLVLVGLALAVRPVLRRTNYSLPSR
jgi:hypothetical protein